MIKALQVELMAIRLKEAESDHNGKECEAKLEEALEVSWFTFPFTTIAR